VFLHFVPPPAPLERRHWTESDLDCARFFEVVSPPCDPLFFMKKTFIGFSFPLLPLCFLNVLLSLF